MTTAISHPATQGLMTRACAGDAKALEELIRQCQPDLRRFAGRHCHSNDVDDAVQDTLMIMTRKLGGLRAVGALSSWLYQVVKRLCLRRLMSASRKSAVEAELDGEPMDDGRLLTLRLDLIKVLSGLSPRHLEVLVLVDLMGHRLEEAAQDLGLTVEATKSRLHRARVSVRKELGAIH